MELFGPIRDGVADCVHANELRSLALASRSCFASAQVALQRRARWVREDYHGFNFRGICTALERVRRLEEFHIDAIALVPNIQDDCGDYLGGTGDFDDNDQFTNVQEDLCTHVQQARKLIEDVVQRNLRQKLANVQVFNDMSWSDCVDQMEDDHGRFFFVELTPLAGQLLSFSTACNVFSEYFEDFLRSAHRLAMLSAPNLTMGELFYSTPQLQCPKLTSIRMLRVCWSDEEGVHAGIGLSCIDARFLSVLVNPFDTVLDRFPHLECIVLTHLPSHYATHSRLASFAADLSLNLEVE